MTLVLFLALHEKAYLQISNEKLKQILLISNHFLNEKTTSYQVVSA